MDVPGQLDIKFHRVDGTARIKPGDPMGDTLRQMLQGSNAVAGSEQESRSENAEVVKAGPGEGQSHRAKVWIKMTPFCNIVPRNANSHEHSPLSMADRTGG